MASIAEQIVGSALQSAQQAPDIAGNMAKGAQLAQQAEQISQNRAKLEQAKQEHELAKFEKVGGWIDTASKMPDGAAKKAFLRNFVPNGIKALGLQDKVDPTVFSMIQGDPNLGSFITHQIRTGKTNMSVLSSPDGVAELAASPEYQQFGGLEALKNTVDATRPELEKAQEAQIKAGELEDRAEAYAAAQANKAGAARADAGNVELSKEIAKKYSDYSAAGGRAGLQSALTSLRSAANALQTGTVVTGGISNKIPGFKSDDVQSSLNPKLLEMRTQAQAALNTVLRSTLGAQFTEREGERVLNQVWDDKLSPGANAKKILNKVKELESNVKGAESEFRRFGFMSEKTKSAADEGTFDIGGRKLNKDQIEALLKKNAKFRDLIPAAVLKETGL